jgi:hypothetical protein
MRNPISFTVQLQSFTHSSFLLVLLLFSIAFQGKAGASDLSFSQAGGDVTLISSIILRQEGVHVWLIY